jgi:hypothetical protein
MKKTMKHILLIGVVMMATVAQAADEPNYNFQSTSAMPSRHANGRVSNVQVAPPATAAEYMRARGTAKGQVYSASAFSDPKVMQSGGVSVGGGNSAASYSSGSGKRGIDNSNVNVVKLPALDLHNKNAEVQEAAATVSEETKSEPRRVGPRDPEGDPTPIGDGLWVLLLLTLAYLINVRRRTLERVRE